MRLTILQLACLVLYGQVTHSPSFEVATIKPVSPSAPRISCSGGPGTKDPGLWTCTNVPLSFLITEAYSFQPYQFRPNHPCCQDRFDLSAKVPKGTSKEQFRRMMQTLLEDRFQLKLHREKKEMPIYELSVGDKGPKLKAAIPNPSSEPEDPWTPAAFRIGKDGYPVFPPGRNGLQGPNGYYRWVGFNLSMPEITKTLSFHLGRPVLDATGLRGNFNVDLRWWIDVAAYLAGSGHEEDIKNLPDSGAPGPTLIHAVHDQLGLKLTSRKGSGDIVVIDSLRKLPTEN